MRESTRPDGPTSRKVSTTRRRPASAEDVSLGPEELEAIFARVGWVDVAVIFIDSVYDSEVRFLRRYFASGIVSHARWRDVVSMDVLETRPDGALSTIPESSEMVIVLFRKM